MELGIGMFGDLTFDRHTNQFQPAGQKLNEIIEQVKLADEIGIDVVSMGEHHREERLHGMQDVGGSIPLSSIKINVINLNFYKNIEEFFYFLKITSRFF